MLHTHQQGLPAQHAQHQDREKETGQRRARPASREGQGTAPHPQPDANAEEDEQGRPIYNSIAKRTRRSTVRVNYTEVPEEDGFEDAEPQNPKGRVDDIGDDDFEVFSDVETDIEDDEELIDEDGLILPSEYERFEDEIDGDNVQSSSVEASPEVSTHT